MELRPWQAEQLRLSDQPKRCIFAAPRTGKTLVGGMLLQTWGQERMLITAPPAVCLDWEALITSLGIPVLRGFNTPLARVKTLLGSKPLGALIINDERLAMLFGELQRWSPQAVIGDESHRFRGVSSDKARCIRQLCEKAKYVRLLSGTPAPNHLGNLWGQLVCLGREAWGSYEKFARRYLIRDAFFRSKVIGVMNVEELLARVRAVSTTVLRSDVFGPEEWQTIVRYVDLPREARKVYDNLANRWHHEFVGGVVSTNHLLTRLLRLQQVSSGYMRADDGTTHSCHTEKIDAVIADLEDIVASGEKAVIFHRFAWEANAYEGTIKKHFGKQLTPKMLNGNSSPNQRAETLRCIREDQGPQIAIVQTEAGGTGVSFAEATHALFVSQVFSYDQETQARDRIYKPGESRCVTYYRARNTVDDYIAKVLAKKHNVQEMLTSSSFEEIVYGGV